MGGSASGFPNPLGWLVGAAGSLLGGAVSTATGGVLGGVTSYVFQGMEWVVGQVFSFFASGADPDVSAGWFASRSGPYARMAGIGAVLLVVFVLAGLAQGALSGDASGMLRRMAIDLPVSVLGMVAVVGLTQLAVRMTDALSQGLLGQFQPDVARFTHAIGTASAATNGLVGGFATLLLAALGVLAGIVLLAELVVRAALVYVVVALAPLAFAAAVWPSIRGMARRAVELLVALVASKLVVAVALAVAAAGAAGAGQSGSLSADVGVLLAALAAFGVAAFSPLLVARLLPATEAAFVAAGIRGGPSRAAQQALTAGYYARSIGGRSARLAGTANGGGNGGGGTGAAGTGAGVAGATGAGAAAGAAASAVSRAAGAGGRAATAPVEHRPPARPRPATGSDPGTASARGDGQ